MRPAVDSVFWFDGAALIAKSTISHGAIPWTPVADGINLVHVIDDHGRTVVNIRFSN
jgi:hypothetical protein